MHSLLLIAISIDCTSNQYAVSVTKKSGSGGALETYTISGVYSGETRVLANGVAVPAGANSTQEFCLDATTDGVYSIELKHSYYCVSFVILVIMVYGVWVLM